MHTLDNERPILQPVDPVGGVQEPEADNAHVAFAIVFLGSLGFFAGGIIWLIVR